MRINQYTTLGSLHALLDTNKDTRTRSKKNPSSHNFNQHKQQRINQTPQMEVQSTVPHLEEQYETGNTFRLYFKCGITGTPVTILVDTGSMNNYISFNCKIGKSVPIKHIKTKTMHGYSLLKSKKKIITLLSHHLAFFEIDELQE